MPEPQTPAAETTIQIDAVAAYYKRRAEAAENESLRLAAGLRDLTAVLNATARQVRMLTQQMAEKDAAPADPPPEEPRPARSRKKGGEA